VGVAGHVEGRHPAPCQLLAHCRKLRIDWDRGTPHGAPLPHHRAYELERFSAPSLVSCPIYLSRRRRARNPFACTRCGDRMPPSSPTRTRRIGIEISRSPTSRDRRYCIGERPREQIKAAQPPGLRLTGLPAAIEKDPRRARAEKGRLPGVGLELEPILHECDRIQRMSEIKREVERHTPPRREAHR